MSFVVTVKGDPLAIVCETKSKARELRKFLREAGYAKGDIAITPRDEPGSSIKDDGKKSPEILGSKTQGENHH